MEHEVGHPRRGPVHGAPDQAAKPVSGIRQQRVLDGPLLPGRHLPHLLHRGRDAGGHDDDPADRPPGLHGGQPVRHEPAIADPDDIVPRHAEEPHGVGGAAGLEGDGAERGKREGGGAEEAEVRRVDVEVAGERGQVARPGPFRVAAEAVEEEERGLGGWGRGAPHAERGRVWAGEAEVDGPDAEAGQEVKREEGVPEGGQPEPEEEPEQEERQGEEREEGRRRRLLLLMLLHGVRGGGGAGRRGRSGARLHVCGVLTLFVVRGWAVCVYL